MTHSKNIKIVATDSENYSETVAIASLSQTAAEQIANALQASGLIREGENNEPETKTTPNETSSASTQISLEAGEDIREGSLVGIKSDNLAYLAQTRAPALPAIGVAAQDTNAGQTLQILIAGLACILTPSGESPGVYNNLFLADSPGMSSFIPVIPENGEQGLYQEIGTYLRENRAILSINQATPIMG